MIELITGIVVAAGFAYLIILCRDKKIYINWFLWVLIVFEAILFVFWVEVVAAFVQEGSLKGALVNGILVGFLVAVFGVLLYRFIFNRRLVKEGRNKKSLQGEDEKKVLN
jgi:ABC-type transport system involved in cytochrome c biogenesis permease subunit